MDADYIDDGCNMQLAVYQVEKTVNLSKLKPSRLWENVKIQPEYYHGFAAVCLDVIKNGKMKVCKEVTQMLRKHLLYLGWKIEFKYDGIMRFRYFSPNGKLYYSLCQVCSDMLVTGHKDTFLEVDNEKVLTDVPVPIITADSESFLDPDTPLEGNAIINYVEYIEKSQGKKDKVLIENAKNYLKQSGWDLHMKQKKTKQELEYTAPGGKNYHSLYTACKAFCVEQRSNTTIMSKKIVKEVQLNEATSVAKKNGRLKNASLTACRAICAEQHSHAITVSNEFMKKVLLNEDSSEINTNGLPITKSRKRKRERGKRIRLLTAASANQHDRKSILSWLLRKGIISLRQKVSYIREKDGLVMKTGRVTPDGIKCMCCRMLFSPAKFQAHAGSDTSQSASRIYFSDGKSLLQCQIEAINSNKCNYESHVRSKRDYSSYDSDFLCSICCDGGNILLCDHCPSAFHPECVGLKEIPEGSWYCPSCKCHLCGKSEFYSDAQKFLEKSIIYCDQCERGCHVGCFKGKEPSMLCSTVSWFCSQECSKINDYLEKILGKPNCTRENEITWTILRSKRRNEDNFDVETTAEYHSKLNVALDVLHECFETFIEPRTQSDVVSDMLFNRASELRRLNFWGVYTVILEKGDEIISVATLRVFGNYVAEISLVGTRFRYRELGMCRLLVTEIEKMLMELGVKMLVLPAAPSVLRTWIESFEFIQMNTSDRMNLLEFSLLNFQDAFMCYKHLNKVSSPSYVSEEKDECYLSSTNACTGKSEDIPTFQNNNVIGHQMFPRNLMYASTNNSYEESMRVQSNNVKSLSNACEETKGCHQSSTDLFTNDPDFLNIENNTEINVALSFLTSVF